MPDYKACDMPKSDSLATSPALTSAGSLDEKATVSQGNNKADDGRSAMRDPHNHPRGVEHFVSEGAIQRYPQISLNVTVKPALLHPEDLF